jgi:hypothetical protein
VNALLNDIVAQGRYGANLVEQAIDDASTGTLGEIMDEMRAWSRSMEIPAYEVQGIFQEIIDTLQSEGYGGFTHTGGAKAGGGKRLHTVSIYWNPADAIGLKEMRPVVTPEVMDTTVMPRESLTAGEEPIDPTKFLKSKDRNLVMNQFKVDPQKIIDDANNKVKASQWGGTREAPEFAAWAGADSPDENGAVKLYEGKSKTAAKNAADAYTKKEIARAVDLVQRARAAAASDVMDATVMPPEPAAPRPRRIADTLLPPGTELYHGTTNAGRKGIMASGFRASSAESAGTVLGEGAYFTGNQRYASAYGEKTVWGELPSEAKILDLAGQGKTVADLADEAGVTGPRETYRGDVRLSYEQQQQVKDWAAANGYSGIRFKSFDTPDKPQLETVFYDLELANKMVGAQITPEVMDATVMPPEPAVPRPLRIADTLRATLRTLAESDARLYRASGETVGEASGAPQFTLSSDLAKTSPRYGRNTLKFESDLDRTAYLLAKDKTKGSSKSANKFRNELIAAGFDPDQVAAHGKTVKEAVESVLRDTSGGEVVVPVQDFAAGRPRLPLPEQQRQIEGTKAQIDDLQQKLNEGGCGT